MKKMKIKMFMLLAMFIVIIGAEARSAAAQTYQNPSQAETDKWRKLGPCRDPWISKAVADSNANTRFAYGFGDYGECNPANYNNGQWSSFDQLFKTVDAARSAMNSSGIGWHVANLSSGRAAVFLADSRSIIDGNIYGGLQFVGNNGSALVASGGGNLVASGGGNLVASGGGNLVASGGGNFSGLSNIAGLAKVVSANTYSIRSPAKKVVKIGANTYLIIQ